MPESTGASHSAVGIFTSPLAGRLSDRVGRPRILMTGVALQLAGAVATLVVALPLKLLGLALFTLGFFTVHAVASTGVGHRGGTEKAAASAHYLLAYDTGSSAIGTLGGLVFARAGWGGHRGARLGAPRAGLGGDPCPRPARSRPRSRGAALPIPGVDAFRTL